VAGRWRNTLLHANFGGSLAFVARTFQRRIYGSALNDPEQHCERSGLCNNTNIVQSKINVGVPQAGRCGITKVDSLSLLGRRPDYITSGSAASKIGPTPVLTDDVMMAGRVGSKLMKTPGSSG